MESQRRGQAGLKEMIVQDHSWHAMEQEKSSTNELAGATVSDHYLWLDVVLRDSRLRLKLLGRIQQKYATRSQEVYEALSETASQCPTHVEK